jgi:hypothetical protein
MGIPPIIAFVIIIIYIGPHFELIIFFQWGGERNNPWLTLPISPTSITQLPFKQNILSITMKAILKTALLYV